MSSKDIDIGRTIQRVRQARGLSQRQVGDLIGSYRAKDGMGRPIALSTAGLSRIEAGTRLPSFPTMQALAWALQVRFEIGPDGTTIELEEEAAA